VYSDDPADLFSELYDDLPERLFALDADAEMWLTDDAVHEIAADVEHEVVGTGLLSSETLERLLDYDEDGRSRFAILLGLDRAFLQTDLTTGSHDTGALVEVALRYMETGRLSTRSVSGALLPKVAVPSEDHRIPESMRDAFSAVIRVPATTPITVDHKVLEDWPSRTVREAGLFVAALPAFGQESRMDIGRVEADVPAYRLRLMSLDNQQRWVEDHLQALDATRATVALLPEMALYPDLLEEWRRACRAHPRPQGTRLRWIVLGSGPEPDPSQKRPHNRAVVIDRTTGDQAWTQDKQYRFQLDDDLIERWNLGEYLGRGPLEEWITVGSSLTIMEAPGFRSAIFICEDLTELNTVGATATAWGLSHAFCPIFSQAIRKFRWEQQHAQWLQRNAGIQTVVCNSQYIGDAEPHVNEPVGDVLAVAGTVLLAPQGPFSEPRVLRFSEHGVFLIA
jgi:predicted amidohydrolase